MTWGEGGWKRAAIHPHGAEEEREASSQNPQASGSRIIANRPPHLAKQGCSNGTEVQQINDC